MKTIEIFDIKAASNKWLLELTASEKVLILEMMEDAKEEGRQEGYNEGYDDALDQNGL